MIGGSSKPIQPMFKPSQSEGNLTSQILNLDGFQSRFLVLNGLFFKFSKYSMKFLKHQFEIYEN